MKNFAIIIDRVSKIYECYDQKHTIIEKLLFKKKNNTFFALKKLSFQLNRGQSLGIFGPNGSGKSTLLKIIAGITIPSEGAMNITGRVVSLIDLEAGFHPELSGIDNIYLNGMIIGMSRKKIDEQINKIIKFADIGAFIYAPIFTYSQGMKLRLGLSIAIYSEPDILLIDEVIYAGDKKFQKKSKKKINELFNNKTVVLVSHSPEYIMNYCDTLLVLDKGSKKYFGDTKKYFENNL